MPDSTQFMQEMTRKDQKKEAPEPRSVRLSEPITESNRFVRLQARFQFAHEERSVQTRAFLERETQSKVVRSRFKPRFVETSWILSWNLHPFFILCKAIINICSYIYSCSFELLRLVDVSDRKDGDGAGIPEPVGDGDEVQFLIPVGYGRVTGKYMRIRYGTENVKPVPTLPHCHAYSKHL
ncbi:hypothetical protein MTR_7g010570 [Medicago truncatula]|uniref:Uncharacterized protein n=1 Tax=Medicago truncatula TaxID=3880 RepID=G7L0Z4_MEDTR|nr:hypothetical protein MTR_7g010570 [Medicago truncatula]